MILVTGGLGTIGPHAARAVLDLGESVVLTAHRSTRPPGFLADRATIEPLDVTDRDALIELGTRHDISGIVHLAAAGLTVTDSVEFLRINTDLLLNALEAARTWKVRRFALASSIGVYLGRPEAHWHEELALPATSHDNPIPAFKKAAETLTTQALAGAAAPVLLRIGTICGPLGDPASPFLPIPHSLTPPSTAGNRYGSTPTTAATAATPPTPAVRSR
jgi:nucleoside-diphosphate-sugar epimerase